MRCDFYGCQHRKPSVPAWRALYEAAVLELDPAKIPARIAEAQRAVMNRMDDLNRSSDGCSCNRLWRITDATSSTTVRIQRSQS